METIVVFTGDRDLNAVITATISESLQGFRIKTFESRHGVLDLVYDSPPALVILGCYPDHREFVNVLREDPILSNLPIMMILPAGELVERWTDMPVDDYLRAPPDADELRMRVSLAIFRAHRVVETNPLTMLPGNTPIVKEVQARLERGAEFALAYADLDNFKPFNDKYGFTRGDEILRMSARLITNIVKHKAPKDCFIGHIGGDDFVFMIAPEKADAVCAEIISGFDRIIPTFYDSEDRESGFIISHDRAGNRMLFPMLSISIGVTINNGAFEHYGAISSAASEMKKYAKGFEGSVYRIDKREKGA
ncbi:MAG: diguanylate cyclase [Nitrospirae bacterium]|nr:diguanylate cyclase [Nitrospirota bacterium]